MGHDRCIFPVGFAAGSPQNAATNDDIPNRSGQLTHGRDSERKRQQKIVEQIQFAARNEQPQRRQRQNQHQHEQR